ncbi:MAG: amidohydrolase [Eubacteriales bacterium]|nr:amidohydrolase [Eubacteriales bacterium]
MTIRDDRRALHRIPELDKSLPETFAYLHQALLGLNCRVFSPVAGSLCAFFDFGQADAIAFRADADALPIAEKTGAEYSSRHPGCMHACGHDGHMAILLELARRLSKKSGLPHNVLLVFQSAEETTGGAKDICGSGVFMQYHVKAIFGLHLWPGLEAGEIASRRQELMARSCEVNVDIYGKSAHIAKAAEGVDALMAGMEFYQKAMEMEGKLPDSVFRLLKFGKFQSGTVRNALSAHTHMEGSLRAFQDEVFDGLAAGLAEIGKAVEEQHGCSVKLHLSDGYPAVMNPPELYDRVGKALPFRELESPSMTAEDFSWYQKTLPGLFFFLGLGDVPALHTDTFDFDETILLKGADFFEKLAETAL